MPGTMPQLHTVARVSDLPPGSATCVDVAGRRLAVFNVDGTYYAVDDECPHSGGPLSEGDLDGTRIECPWHGAVFDLTDGAVKCPPAEEGVGCYRVQVDGDEVKVEIP